MKLTISFDLVDPSSDVDIRPQITCHATRVTSDKLDPMRFERFSSWRSLIRAVARLVHVICSFKQGSSCKGWHIHESLCSKEELDEREPSYYRLSNKIPLQRH